MTSLCISVCTIHSHSCVTCFQALQSCLIHYLQLLFNIISASLEPASSLLPPLSFSHCSNLNLRYRLSQFRPPPHNLNYSASLTQPLPPPASSLLTRPHCQPQNLPSLFYPSQPSSSVFQSLSETHSASQPPSDLQAPSLTYWQTAFVNYQPPPASQPPPLLNQPSSSIFRPLSQPVSAIQPSSLTQPPTSSKPTSS